MKRAKPNRMRNAQVMPPHHVDLTLTPGVHHDIHVPAHVTGGDLSREGPLPASRRQELTTSAEQAFPLERLPRSNTKRDR
jgi:hypothetical protein